MKFSGHLGGHAAVHNKPMEEGSEMPHCPGTPLSTVWTQAKSGISHTHQISSAQSQHALARRRVIAVTSAKQRRDRKRDSEVGSLPCLPCSELMKQGELGYTSSINFHTHSNTQEAQ